MKTSRSGAVHENVFQTPLRVAVNIIHLPIRAIVTSEVIVRNRLEIWPKLECRFLFRWKPAHRFLNRQGEFLVG